jgi:transposase
MQVQELLKQRKQRGIEIALTNKVVSKDGVWVVPSASNPKQTYKVQFTLYGATCTCQDYAKRGIRCKHIFACEVIVEKSYDKEGKLIKTEVKKITYPQNWSAYTKAQTEELRLFNVLLKDLVQNVEEPAYTFGRPKTSLREVVFCSVEKVYSQLSSRRARSLYKDAQEKEQIGKAPSYNMINITLNSAEITPILHKLLEITALPLRSVESQFAIDSTGFRTTRFGEYCKNKYEASKTHHWVKAHMSVGTKTNVITAVEITDENGNDCPRFIPLMQRNYDNGFDVQEVSADKAYSSRANLELVGQHNGVAYIPFKKNAVGNPHGSRLWRNMFYYFQMNQEAFLEHYHKRSNIESTNMAIKTKLGDCLKNKNFISQTNELLCKLIAYNITVLISAIYELKIEPKLVSS